MHFAHRRMNRFFFSLILIIFLLRATSTSLTHSRLPRALFLCLFFQNSQIKIFLCLFWVLRRRGCVVCWHRPASKLHKSAPWNFVWGLFFILIYAIFKHIQILPFCVLHRCRLDVKNSLNTHTHMDSPFCAYENAYFALTSISSVLVRLSLFPILSLTHRTAFLASSRWVCVWCYLKSAYKIGRLRALMQFCVDRYMSVPQTPFSHTMRILWITWKWVVWVVGRV